MNGAGGRKDEWRDGHKERNVSKRKKKANSIGILSVYRAAALFRAGHEATAAVGREVSGHGTGLKALQSAFVGAHDDATRAGVALVVLFSGVGGGVHVV